MRPTLNGNRRGFTLIEVMVAVAVASFGLLILTNLFARVHSANRYASDYTRAVLLAKQKIEEFRLAPRDQIEGLLKAAKAPRQFENTAGDAAGPGFKWSAAVLNRWRDLIEVEVDVSWEWPDGGGGVKSTRKHVKLSSFF